MLQHKRLWVALAVVIAGSFAGLGGVGYNAVSNAPPIPGRVVSANGDPILDHPSFCAA